MSASHHESGLAAALVERVAVALPGAEVVAQADRHRLSLTRFANSVIHQNVAEDATSVRLQVHHDGRTASGSMTVTTPDDLPRLVEQVTAAVRVAPLDPTWPGLTDPAAAGATEPVDEATAHASPEDRARVVRDFVDATEGLEAAGYVRTNHWTGAFASSSGQSLSGEATECGLSGIARHDGSDGLARSAPTRFSGLDGTALGARAAAKARAWSAPVELPPGHYEVVLEPTAVADILGNLAAHAFSGRALNEHTSFVRLGEAQLDAAISITDDPLAAGLAYDSEGTPRQRLPLVADGRTVGVTHDRRSAAEAGVASTGHRGVENALAWGPTARHLSLAPDSTAADEAGEAAGPVADSSVATLVSGVERGLLVSDFWYTRVLDPRSVAMTGLTRNGVWLIEDGQVSTPVQNFRFTQSYSQALAPGNVRAVGDTAAAVPGDTYTTTSPRWTCPALHLGSWNFTGGSSG
jgi:predicted Zn-dependent protease